MEGSHNQLRFVVSKSVKCKSIKGERQEEAREACRGLIFSEG